MASEVTMRAMSRTKTDPEAGCPITRSYGPSPCAVIDTGVRSNSSSRLIRSSPNVDSQVNQRLTPNAAEHLSA